MDALTRAILGLVVPITKQDDLPKPYRQTLPAPLAPTVSEAEVPPITDAPNQPSIS